MQITKYSDNGRTFAVIFECRRCRTTAARTLEECMKECEYNFITDLRPPKEWRDGGFYYPIFCPECAEKYDRFMNMEDEKDV